MSMDLLGFESPNPQLQDFYLLFELSKYFDILWKLCRNIVVQKSNFYDEWKGVFLTPFIGLGTPL